MSGPFIPPPPAYRFGVGFEYASQLARKMQSLSFAFLLSSGVVGGLALVLALCAALSGSAETAEGGLVSNHAGLWCGVSAAIAVALAMTLWRRSVAAGRGAAIASRAIFRATIPDVLTDEDEEDEDGDTDEGSTTDADDDSSEWMDGSGDLLAYAACVQVQAAWLENRLSEERASGITDTLDLFIDD